MTRTILWHEQADIDDDRTACGLRWRVIAPTGDARPEGGRPCLSCHRQLSALWRNRGG